jgi:hypothetical protein
VTFVFPPQLPEEPFQIREQGKLVHNARRKLPEAISHLGIRPNLQRVTIRVQMSVLEASWILQPESEHSVEANVSDPDQGERKNRKAI